MFPLGHFTGDEDIQLLSYGIILSPYFEKEHTQNFCSAHIRVTGTRLHQNNEKTGRNM